MTTPRLQTPRSAPRADASRPIRVLYSFPHKIGADRICHTAWHQVDGLTAAGAEVLVMPGVLHKPFGPGVVVRPTLALGKLRISYKLVGTKRACAWHDAIVASRLRKLAGKIDVVHTWPMGALKTLGAARKLGIPTVLERPNAHTRFAYRVVQQECERLGITMPEGHEHAMKSDWLQIEEQEYALADFLLCPSDFVAQTFIDLQFEPRKLLRHQYGFDHRRFRPREGMRPADQPFTLLFAGGCAPRKGLHYALEAWLASPARQSGKFLIAGEFIPGYAERLGSMLTDPSIELLGFRRDVPQLMQRSDAFILPTIEEGSALVTSEARGCGCVLLVSDAAGAICKHGHDSLVHKVRDVAALTEHITRVYSDSHLLAQLRANSLSTVDRLTWTSAGQSLLAAYTECLSRRRK